MSIPVDAPHESGRMSCNVWIKPASTQAAGWKKTVVIDAIRAITTPVKYLLSADVSVKLVWFINEKERYESDKSPDVDNIIKPVLDALSGTDGVLIDDCQIQHVSSHWVSRYDEAEHLEITIEYEPDAYFNKRTIAFVQLQKALCMPLNKSAKPEALKILLDAFEKQLDSRNKILAQDGDYYQAKNVMSIQRLFHRSRVKDFEVFKLTDLRASIEKCV